MPKRKQYGFLLSDKERALLHELAESAGMTMSAYLRILIKQADRDRRVDIPRKKPERITEYAQ